MKMTSRGNAPKLVTWVICLVLYAVALGGHFNFFHPGPVYVTWSWIVGFGLLLVACRFRGL